MCRLQANKRTVKDSYALPHIDELIDHFEGGKYFSSLDLLKGYYQVEIKEEHKSITAFTVGKICSYAFRSFEFAGNISTIDVTMYG